MILSTSDDAVCRSSASASCFCNSTVLGGALRAPVVARPDFAPLRRACFVALRLDATRWLIPPLASRSHHIREGRPSGRGENRLMSEIGQKRKSDAALPQQCPLHPRKRTSESRTAMSALGQRLTPRVIQSP